MSIYVAVKEGDTSKNRGDLLENISKKLLEAHDYEVETEVRKTGMELDLLCQNKTNPAKKMYVECKAYNDDSRIQADVVTNLSGRLYIKKYREAWLIATSELGKEALANAQKEALFDLVGVQSDNILYPQSGGCGSLIWWKAEAPKYSYDCGMG